MSRLSVATALATLFVAIPARAQTAPEPVFPAFVDDGTLVGAGLSIGWQML